MRVPVASILGAALFAIALAGGGCAQKIQQGSGGAAAGGNGGAGGEVVDAGPDVSEDAPPGPCFMAEDCPPLTNDPCNIPVCKNGACSKDPANDGAACDDGLFCTKDDSCFSGVCVGGTNLPCPQLDACHVGACDEANKKCTGAPGNDGMACDDADPCTKGTTCSNGTCGAGTPIDCSVYDSQCSVGICDPVTGCKPSPANENGVCDDGKASPCSTGKCVAGLCTSVPANEGAACNDNLFCTIGDHCEAGTCTPTGPNICAPPGGCYVAVCNEAMKTCSSAPGNDGQPCDDFNTCTTGTTCLNGACIGGSPTNQGGACDDGSGCTSGEFCTNGVCGGGAGPTVYFGDDFHDNSKGWQLDQEWQIGPAMASTGEDSGYGDPAMDHSLSVDNGVAGVVIGGNADTAAVHPYRYLTSPSFNTANAAGPVIFGFYRWLNSDYDPYMVNAVDVYNGSTWVNLWTSGAFPGVEDDAWTFFQYDVTAHKNAAMRVRFGFKIGQTLALYTMSSWNVDDVLVASAACP